MGNGELAALAASACWAAASMLYGRTRLSAWGMNLAKNVLAASVLFVQLLILSQGNVFDAFHADSAGWGWLALSGVIGIVIGDTLYFRSLQILGPRKALIITTTAPFFAAFADWLLLGEVLTVTVMSGVVLTIGGVVYVVADRKSPNESPNLFPGSVRVGVVAALASAVCQALGGVCSRIGMRDCDGVEGAFIRLSVSALCGFFVVVGLRQLNQVIVGLRDRNLLRHFVPAVLMGTWLGIWFSQIAYKLTTVSIATTLLATTPLFVLPLLWFFDGQKISRRAFVGALVAVAGVVLVVS